jgi:hypothetical protein
MVNGGGVVMTWPSGAAEAVLQGKRLPRTILKYDYVPDILARRDPYRLGHMELAT